MQPPTASTNYEKVKIIKNKSERQENQLSINSPIKNAFSKA